MTQNGVRRERGVESSGGRTEHSREAVKNGGEGFK